jgi:RHS repeat-associated protein
VTRRTYPGSTGVDYTYDPLNRLATVVDGSNTTGYAYDPASNLVQTTLPSGNGYVESRGYDRAGRLTEVKNQRSSTVLSQFVSTLDPVGNPTQVVRTGSLAETQTYTYDANDRITGVCLQAGTCPGASDPFIRWTYDKVGNRLTEQRPNGVTTAYTYDARDRLLSAGSTSFAYDQNGNQTQKGTRTFAYDLANRLKTTTQGSTTTYLYDGEGKRVEASGGGTPAAPALRAPCSTATGSSASATVNRPTGTVQGDLLVVGIAFEKGSAVAITPPSGWTLIRRTDQSSDVGYATYRKTAGASEGSSYSFALTNTPKWSIGSCAIAGTDPTAPIDVHNGAIGSSGNPSAPSVTTTGPNRLVLAFYANKKAATFSSYTSPALERWDAPNSPGGLPSNAMAAYELPAAGASGAKSAVASEQEKWVAQQIAIAPAPGGGVTRFLWDVNQGLPQLALEREGSGNPLRSYVYGERRISQTAGSNTSYFLHDGLGSVANLTSSSGVTQWTYAYEPFGTTRVETSNSGPTSFMKFTGEYQTSTSLYHLRAREYDVSNGRFLSIDPAVSDIREGRASPYTYAVNRPLVFVDPSGETFEPSGQGLASARMATSPDAPPSPVYGDPGNRANLCTMENPPCELPGENAGAREALAIGLALVGTSSGTLVVGASARFALGAVLQFGPTAKVAIPGAVAAARANAKPLTKQVYNDTVVSVRVAASYARAVAREAPARAGELVGEAKLFLATTAAATSRFVGREVDKFAECLRTAGQSLTSMRSLTLAFLTCVNWDLRRDYLGP